MEKPIRKNRVYDNCFYVNGKSLTKQKLMLMIFGRIEIILYGPEHDDQSLSEYAPKRKDRKLIWSKTVIYNVYETQKQITFLCFFNHKDSGGRYTRLDGKYY